MRGITLISSLLLVVCVVSSHGKSSTQLVSSPALMSILRSSPNSVVLTHVGDEDAPFSEVLSFERKVQNQFLGHIKTQLALCQSVREAIFAFFRFRGNIIEKVINLVQSTYYAFKNIGVIIKYLWLLGFKLFRMGPFSALFKGTRIFLMTAPKALSLVLTKWFFPWWYRD